MTNFILGYLPKSDMTKLTRFKSVEDAEYRAEEWCIVYAETLDEATEKYEETFLNLKASGKINGPF